MTPSRFLQLNPHVTRRAFHAETTRRGRSWNVIFTDTDGKRHIVYDSSLRACLAWMATFPEPGGTP